MKCNVGDNVLLTKRYFTINNYFNTYATNFTEIFLNGSSSFLNKKTKRINPVSPRKK